MFDNPSSWMKIDEPFFAIGSGSTTALGAMHAGATTAQAIKAATKVDPFTGMGVKTLKLGD
jgi:ATP-dependent protease HslVU (ClpYQ) peptidase subunit